MLPKFLESLGNNLAHQWLAQVFSPAFIFWFGGILAWISRFEWENFESFLSQENTTQPLFYLLSGLLIIGISAIIVQRIELYVLRFLEGYWFRWMNPVRHWFINIKWKQAKKVRCQLKRLSQKGLEVLTTNELDEYVRLDCQRRQTPYKKEYLMPTRLGNILRTAERRSFERYGLELSVCFPRLWLLLSNDIKAELAEARAQLNVMVRIWIWGFLFLGWSVWAWWAIPTAIIVMCSAYFWMLDAALIYGDLLESTFDLNRTLLYKSLRFPLPKDPTEEQQRGRALTEYLWRGFTDPELTFEELE